MLTPRPSWNSYFLSLAATVATRATCPRKQVGCVLVRDRMVIASGYNGAIRGVEHCPTREETGGWAGLDCTEGTGHCTRSLHAEVNAITQSARHGASTLDCTAYVTVMPCLNCYRLLANAGVSMVIYAAAYGEKYEVPASGPRMLCVDEFVEVA